MSTVSLILRLGLALVFAVAAGAKLADRAGTRDAVIAFGAPVPAAGALAVALPIAELLTAALLLPAATAVAGAIAALALLAVFCAAIGVNLASGRAPDCHCFGQLHSAPVGWGTLARNAGLGVAAGVVLAGGDAGPTAVAWIGQLHGSALVIVVAGAIVTALAVAFVSLLRAYGRVLVRLDHVERVLEEAGLADVALDVIGPAHGLAPGTPAPPFALPDLSGVEVSLSDLLAPRHPLLLMFASPGCGPCSALLPHVALWQREHRDRLTIAVASDGRADDVRAKAEEVGLDRMLLDADGTLYERYEADGTPSAVLIAADGTIASHVAAGADAIERLAQDVIDAPGLPVGAPAPTLELTTLDGEEVTVGEPLGTETVLLFWNPDCGYCRQIHADVLGWEAIDGPDRPRLIVVSSGDRGRTREDGFRSTVVLDPSFAAARAVGASGTPSAVRIDGAGRVASEVATGSPAVLTLVGALAAVAP